jgi:hypothetical protein
MCYALTFYSHFTPLPDQNREVPETLWIEPDPVLSVLLWDMI